MQRCLRMEGDIRRTSLGEHLDELIDRGGHQVAVERCRDAAFSESLHDKRADCQVRDVMVVHNIDMNDIGSGLEDIPYLVSEPREISREDRGSNKIFPGHRIFSLR